MSQSYLRLGRWVVKNYHDARKIVEIGVGHFPLVAAYIKRELPHVDVIVTDVDREKLRKVRSSHPRLHAELDDILAPKLGIYRGSSLLYSLRPPPELVPYIVDVARRVAADVLIRPLSGEEAGFDFSSWTYMRSLGAYLLRL